MKVKADYIIVLVGTNPIPNFISILALAEEGSVIYLVYTEDTYESIGTKKVSDNLEKAIKKFYKQVEVKAISCEKSRPLKIKETVHNIFSDIEILNEDKNSPDKTCIHLDYTGGTKSMAAIFYNDFNLIKKENLHYDFTFSYVDSELDRIFIEGIWDGIGISISKVAENLSITCDDIIELHGYHKEDFSEIKFYSKGFKLLCQYISEKSIKNECKFEIFQIKSKAIKAGGDQAEILLKFNCNEDTKNKLISDISDSSRLNSKEKIHILGIDDDLEENRQNIIREM